MVSRFDLQDSKEYTFTMVEVGSTLKAIHNSLTPPGETLPPEVREARFLDGFRQLRAEGIPVIVGADVDKNLAGYTDVNGEIPGLDPRGVVIDPQAREALAKMHAAGVPIVISTSRGAAEVSQYLKIPGITIIGSQGLEVRQVDDVDWRKGESKIDPRFEEYQVPMNAMMRDVYRKFVAGLSEDSVKPEDVTLPTEPVFEIPTPEGGRIVVQLKGQSEQFPMGIAMALNVNQPIAGTREDYLTDENRRRIADAQAKYLTRFRQIFNEAWVTHFPGTTQESMAGIMSVRTRNETIRYNDVDIPTLDLEIRPGMESGKGHAQVQIMRPDEDDKRQAHFRGAPYAPVTIFSGDSIELSKLGYGGTGQDYAPMRVGHLALKRIGTGGVIGIQTLRPGGSDQAIPDVDIVVDGPAGLGNLLMKMAQVVQESRPAA